MSGEVFGARARVGVEVRKWEMAWLAGTRSTCERPKEREKFGLRQ